MSVTREQQQFPTRNYPYRGQPRGAVAPLEPVLPNTLYRRVLGLDAGHSPMTPEELRQLTDPFGRLLRSGQPFPLTLKQVLAALDALNGTPNALPDQLVFLAADGGHIPWTPETDGLQRAFRFVVARGAGEFTLLISSSTRIESAENGAFLQVIGWDATHEVFHYYERLFGVFFWAGMSPHALADGTRGLGPFDSHVNGSLVMKELRAPWVHWHAPQAGINEEAFAPNDPLRNEPLFRNRVSAERLESEVVRPGIRRWNEARVRKAVGADGVWRQAHHFLRQAITDTTVNLATSDTASRSLTDEMRLRPPHTFFLNSDTLFDTLGLAPDDPAVADITISGAHFRQLLARYDAHRTDGALRINGDSHFAFLTPEPAFEDTNLIDVMMQAGLLTPRFTAALAMTDFSNPVFSPRRAALLRYTPTELSVNPTAGEALASRFVENVQAVIANNEHHAAAPDSPEREFLANWETENFETVYRRRITDYLLAAQSGMNNLDIVDGWFRLAEYRRRRFRRRPLAEFNLTTPRTNIPENAPPLRMTLQGRVEPLA